MCIIAVYNCQQSHKRAVPFLTQKMGEGVDACCTQESGTRLSLNGYINETPNFMGCEGYLNDPCIVVTQTKERPKKTDVLKIKAGLNENRSALLVVLRNGLVVVNVHLTSGNERRSKAELSEIFEHLQSQYKKTPWLVIGDFNHDPSGDYTGVYIGKGPKHSSGNYLDWAMAANISAMSVGHYPRYFGSDHGPWSVDITL